MQIKNNKTKQLLTIGGTAILSLVLFPQETFATYLSADFGVGESVFLKVDGVETIQWAGSIKINVDDSQAIALCVDLFVPMSINQIYGTNLGTPGQIYNGGRVAWLLDNELPQRNTAATLAGLQLAIWDIVHDNGDGFSLGRIQAATQSPTDVLALDEANMLLALSAGQYANDATVFDNYELSCNRTKVQTLMGPGADASSDPAGVPEPQSFAMIALGAIAGGCLKLRRK
jgi:hypothetical protein